MHNPGLIGGYVPKDAFQEISVCSYASETKCFSAWRTYDESYKPGRRDKIDDNYAVVNPLNWTIMEPASPSENIGAYIGTDRISFIKNAVGARVSKNQVIVDASKYKSLSKKGNLHNYDYNLFYLNIRNNVADRLESFEKTNKNHPAH